jgi:Electron transfer flavoprotein domain
MVKGLSKRVLDQAVATGADELVLFQDDAFDGLDSYSIAYGLAAVIRKIGAYDLILCGGQAADSNSGQVGFGIAEFLNIPCSVRPLQNPNNAVIPANTLWGTGAGIQKSLIFLDVAFASEDTGSSPE